MSREEFKNYIKSIGFEYTVSLSNIERYDYKNYIIDLYQVHDVYQDHYDLCNGSIWTYDIKLNDLTLLQNKFKRELRSIKLKKLLL